MISMMKEHARMMQESIESSFKMIAEKMGDIEQRLVKSDNQLKNISNDTQEVRTSALDDENKNKIHF